IARVSAKIAVGRRLDEIPNAVTGTTMAAFEPALDYVVVKIPRWPFDKFPTADRTLFTQMKATGEVMAIDRTFESAFLKAIRGLEVRQKDLRSERWSDASEMPTDDDTLRAAITQPTDDRLWAICEGLRRGWSVPEVNHLCRVDPWFLRKLQRLIEVEQRLVRCGESGGESEPLAALVGEAFLLGFPSPSILDLLGVRDASPARATFNAAAATEVERCKVQPVFKMVDTCAGEFESSTPYFYGTFETEDDATALALGQREVAEIGPGR
ncbi:MAG: carbamoyl phosphate synthase large subunit, partial [Armatimonadota bacterium]